MAFNHEYPYTDPYRVNADWLLHKVKELDKKVNDMLTSAIEKAINAYFNKIMINAIYHEELEEIELKKEIVSGDGVHVYSMADNSMTIENYDCHCNQ